MDIETDVSKATFALVIKKRHSASAEYLAEEDFMTVEIACEAAMAHPSLRPKSLVWSSHQPRCKKCAYIKVYKEWLQKRQTGADKFATWCDIIDAIMQPTAEAELVIKRSREEDGASLSNKRSSLAPQTLS